MKYLIRFWMICCIFSYACNQENSSVEKGVSQLTISTDTAQPSNKDLPGVQSNAKPEPMDLVPLTIINAKSEDVLERYGIDFQGNCYACDLASVSITGTFVDLVNVCNKTDLQRYERFTYSASPEAFSIILEKTTLTFTRIDPAPVYELRQQGEQITLRDKKLSKYYTLQKQFSKFKQHDCGEFDG